jgi:crossover junction endodeoxyribonuclease RusA
MEDKGILLILPVPPTLNHQKAIVRGRMVKTAEHRKYMTAVQNQCIAEGVKPITGEVSVKIRWYRARRSGDVDGRLKSVLDALQGFAYHNDSQVADLHITRLDTDPDLPRMVVTVEKYS